MGGNSSKGVVPPSGVSGPRGNGRMRLGSFKKGSNKKVPISNQRTISPANDARGTPTTTNTTPSRTTIEMKTPTSRKSTSRHKILRDHNRLAACGLGKHPALSPETSVTPLPSTSRQENEELKTAAKKVEALATMVQYLAHELDGFSMPNIKRRLAAMTAAWQAAALERDELLAGHRRLQEELLNITDTLKDQLEDLHTKHEEELTEVEIKYKEDMETELADRDTLLKTQHEMAIAILVEEQKSSLDQITTQHIQEVARLQGEHEQNMSELRALYESQLTAAQEKIQVLDEECTKGKSNYESIVELLNSDIDTRLQITDNRCKDLHYEVNSLRTVLEIRLEEIHDLRRKNAMYEQERDELQSEINKNSSLVAKVEDLQAQLELKSEQERKLSLAQAQLNDNLLQESFQSKHLARQNEELQWKLKTQSELYDQLASGSDDVDITVNRYLRPCNTLSGSCPEKIVGKLEASSVESSPTYRKNYLERSDSIAWTYEMDDPAKEPGETSRAVRRNKSFQEGNSSPRYSKPSITPREKKRTVELESLFADWPLTTSTPHSRPIKESEERGDRETFPLPEVVSGASSLDSTVGTDDSTTVPSVLSGPSPKEAAGEAMISEETSEEDDSCEQTTDEDTSSEVVIS